MFVQVCAYALRQHNLEAELGDKSVIEMPFAKALQLAKGTVVIVDGKGMIFTRIWCK